MSLTQVKEWYVTKDNEIHEINKDMSFVFLLQESCTLCDKLLPKTYLQVSNGPAPFLDPLKINVYCDECLKDIEGGAKKYGNNYGGIKSSYRLLNPSGKQLTDVEKNNIIQLVEEKRKYQIEKNVEPTINIKEEDLVENFISEK
jgi:hypothetical protein